MVGLAKSERMQHILVIAVTLAVVAFFVSPAGVMSFLVVLAGVSITFLVGVAIVVLLSIPLFILGE